MKKLNSAVFCLLSGICFGQISIDTSSSFEHSNDTNELSNINFDGFNKLTEEQKLWIQSTFFIERGKFTIPEKPIQYPWKNE
jgi:hypothetical protein